ncbi:MAG: cation-translocating P-type ATPase [Bacillota bacterium]
MPAHGDGRGLSQAEAKRLLAEHGPNELTREEKRGFLRALATVLREPMFLLLLAAALLYFLLGDAHEAATMLGFVLFVSGITLLQEWRTEHALQALKDLATPLATVIRDGNPVVIPSLEVVPGDALVVSEGERVAADARILEFAGLQTDESLLTGESEPVWKVPDDAQAPAEGPWRRDVLYAGTVALQGKALALVTATGTHTEYGKIGKALAEVQERPTPLQAKTRRLVAGMAWIGLALFALVVVLSFLRGLGWIDAFVAGIALAMGMIPEEFPVVLTVFLALGAWRLAQRKALMRRVPAVETLGAATVLCVDKTGTLTQNRMTVRSLATVEDLTSRAPQLGRAADSALMRLAVLASDPSPTDPMEQAFITMAGSVGVDTQALQQQAPLVYSYPFSSETRRMGQVRRLEGGTLLAAKGSFESILPLCSLSPREEGALAAEAEAMASRGLRVLAVASSTAAAEPWEEDLTAYPFTFCGLVGLADPRSHRLPVWRTLGGNNRARYWVNGLALAALAAIVYAPWLQGGFSTAAIPLSRFLTAAAVALAAVLWWEPLKLLWWRSSNERTSG